MEHKIYKLQNKINGKLYIGRTKNTLNVRMKTHRSPYSNSYLSRALRKYGEHNFSKEIIYTTNNFIDVCEKEKTFILKYNSLAPTGYNLNLGTYGNEVMSEITKNTLSKLNQGNHSKNKNSSSKYIGVHQRRDVKGDTHFEVKIYKNKKNYRHYFHSEIEAAEAYDKVALYLYGLNCKLNFSDKLSVYRNINLKQFFIEFCKKFKSSSQYTGVCKSTKRSKLPWRSYVYINRKYIELGTFLTEEEAYNARKKYLEEHKLNND